MDTLLRTAIKAALGLTQHAATQLLLRLGVHNTIRELVEGHLNSQLQRLQQIRQGCLILSSLGYQTPRKPQLEDRTLLTLSIRNKNHLAPLPQNMPPNRHKGRRQSRAQALALIFGDDTSDTPVLYTDVAQYPQRHTLRASATLNTVESGTAEEAAIALAIVHASTIPAPDGPITVVTDSQTQCRTLAQEITSLYLLRFERIGQLDFYAITALHCSFYAVCRTVWEWQESDCRLLQGISDCTKYSKAKVVEGEAATPATPNDVCVAGRPRVSGRRHSGRLV
ncbi:hypothetical protein HPB49_000970 [Dermacentor silvarum]|uniref:Uncharacterized protein n=1 Tax=Dermacentor silvarum TaxID=543639 RepID=A0ACB8CNJ2_DERSI|nr:hypothetical protein HPB49_000970 [Dermacentor silvarum]